MDTKRERERERDTKRERERDFQGCDTIKVNKMRIFPNFL